MEHHAIADHSQLGRPQHAGRQQRQLVGLAVDDKRMARIVAALETHDDIGLLRQPVDDLALPLVAPLGADDNNVGHFSAYSLCNYLGSSMICSKTAPHPTGSRPRALFCGSCAQPKSRPEPVACEADHRIKDAGYRTKQEGVRTASKGRFNPLISPENLWPRQGSAAAVF